MTESFSLLIPIIAITGGFAIVLFNIYQRGRARELRYRERLAMIERGMSPPAEPMMGDADESARGDHRFRHGRHGSAGVVLIGLGFGLMLILTFAGHNPGAGVGVGGALVVLGVAFVVNNWLCCRTDQAPTSPTPPPVPPDVQPPTLP